MTPKAWLGGVLLFPVLLAVIEVVARGAGYQPSVQDSKALWAMHRDAVRENGPQSVVLLGASRMQLDVDPEILQDALEGKRVFMLAIDGRPPMATLEHFAGDDTFRGTVVCSFTAQWIQPNWWEMQASLLRYWTNEWSVGKRVVLLLHLSLQETCTVLSQGMGVGSFKNRLGGLPYSHYVTTRPSRYNAADYLAMGKHLAAHRSMRIEETRKSYTKETVMSVNEFLAQCDRLERAVRAIQDRGGRVVFVRLPTSGEVWELDEQYYPKKLYWDVFAQRTAAATLHFKDYETLASFECPDGSHLDYRDAAVFTRNLAEIVKEKIE